MKKSKLRYHKTDTRKKKVRNSKFVNLPGITIIFILSSLCLIFFVQLLQDHTIPVILFFVFLMSFLVWHRLYQIFHDLKLVFVYKNGCNLINNVSVKKKFPPLAFIIPSFNEPFEVAKMTFKSILDTPYKGKKEIIVVDNSSKTSNEDFVNWKLYVENFNQNHGVTDTIANFYYNKDGRNLKPGNLDLAQRVIQYGELVVILDVDSTLPNDINILEQAVEEFEKNDMLGMLQFKIKATNEHFNNLTKSLAATQNLHRTRMIYRGEGGYKIFEGHNGMIRKSLLDRTDDWTDYHKGNIMVTEDILKSTQLYELGYYGKSLHIETGEWIPNSLKSLKNMWMRWSYGNSQILSKYFKRIFGDNIKLIEKFDILYHVLDHVTPFLFFATAILLNLFVPGSATNIFILLFYLLPQTIAGVASYFTYANKLDLAFSKKMKRLYAAFFLIDTYIMFIKVKSVINYLLGVSQGWKITEKGIDKIMNWKYILRNESFNVGIILCFTAIFLISWKINYYMEYEGLIYHAFFILIIINLVMCLLLFGKNGRRKGNNVED